MTNNLTNFCFFKTIGIVLEKQMNLGHVSFTPEAWKVIATDDLQKIELEGFLRKNQEQEKIIINRTVKKEDTVSNRKYEIETNPSNILYALAEIVK